ncbi:hypothetical protein [Neptunicoccus sediminis]|uniref:hypothetical protein n=1 Tax=Neptunicoccus sediminis TaxID=1892596 RepID=UPI000845FC23|nr:hypothetical protein [Neptunicoccus sediminis]
MSLYIKNEILARNKFTANTVTQCDPFVYLWENEKNGMKYIGVHNGQKGYCYAGSGKLFVEAFNENPEYFSRVILDHSTSYNYVIEREQYYLNHFWAGGNESWYNLTPMTDQEQQVWRDKENRLRQEHIAALRQKIGYSGVSFK